MSLWKKLFNLFIWENIPTIKNPSEYKPSQRPNFGLDEADPRVIELDPKKMCIPDTIFINEEPFDIIIHNAAECGYYAECPALKGCYSQGETIEELKGNMSEAIELYLEDNPHPNLGNCLAERG